MREDLEPAMVIDNSIVMVWAFDDEDDPYATSVLAALKTRTAVVPPLWLWEVTNALTIAERERRINIQDARQFLQALDVLPIEVVSAPALKDMGELLDLACMLGLTAYDAQYLRLAQSMNLPLATLDRDILRAITSLGTDRFVP